MGQLPLGWWPIYEKQGRPGTGAAAAPAVSGGHRRRGRWGTADGAPRQRGDAFWGSREDGAQQRGFTMVTAIGRWGSAGEGSVHGSPASIDRSACRTAMRQSSWAVWLDQITVEEGRHH
jgi:hypothetical protein